MNAADVKRWAALAVAVALVSGVLDQVGVPSPTLIGATVVGIILALRAPGRFAMVKPADRASQAVIGVALGTTVTAATLPALGAVWLPVMLITLCMVVSTVALGLLLRRVSGLDVGTALLASVPGGVVGLVVMAREMGADERIVAFSQYLRVLAIVVTAPLVATALVVGDGTGAGGAGAAQAGLAAVGVAAGLGLVGWLLGQTARLPAPALLGPLLASAVFTVAWPSVPAHVPTPLLAAAFAVIGLEVGLRFTGDVLRALRRLLPALAGGTLAILGISFALALLLYATTPVSLLDAYLATTPGGLSVVAAAAHGTGANLALITGIQMLRLVVLLAVAPALVRFTVTAVRAKSRAAVPESARLTHRPAQQRRASAQAPAFVRSPATKEHVAACRQQGDEARGQVSGRRRR